MFNIGAGEMVLILVAALLVLGPQRLPELARAIGKFMREFRRHTDDVRNVVEREFYAMDEEVNRAPPPPMGRPGSRFAPPDAAPPVVPVPVPPQAEAAVTPAEPALLPETTAASVATESLAAPSETEPEPALASSPAPTPIPGTVARNAPKRS
ncbi:twin-arginine translocase subunit TatB [Myxococcaceae bacterium JPH2]|nr:twin-arginine translocase subunit TatB [Myxococcaceae bacterium JPH2]